MRALYLTGGRRVELREIEQPVPGHGDVLIAMRAAGLCGSDLHMHYRPAPEERRGPVFGLRTDPDIVPGHEPAGVVAEVGQGVTGFRVGDRVAVHHMGGCGVCRECRRGWDINCADKWGVYGLDRPGAMQDSMVARARDCVPIPEGIGFAEAAYYTCGAGTGYLALRRGGLRVGETVAVVGLGPVGLAAAYFAGRSGASVVGFDTDADRCAFARDLGLGVVADPLVDDPAPVLAEATRGHGADVVVESSGSSSGRLLALDAAALHGRVVLVGFADDSTTIDVQRHIIQKQVDVRGAWMFPITELDALLRDVSLRGISIEPLVPNAFPITEGAAAWRSFDEGALGKTTITWPA